MSIGQEELELLGENFSKFAHDNGLSGMTVQGIQTLYLYETWKDGADWCVIEELEEEPEDRAECERMLIEHFGYNQ